MRLATMPIATPQERARMTDRLRAREELLERVQARAAAQDADRLTPAGRARQERAAGARRAEERRRTITITPDPDAARHYAELEAITRRKP